MSSRKPGETVDEYIARIDQAATDAKTEERRVYWEKRDAQTKEDIAEAKRKWPGCLIVRKNPNEYSIHWGAYYSIRLVCQCCGKPFNVGLDEGDETTCPACERLAEARACYPDNETYVEGKSVRVKHACAQCGVVFEWEFHGESYGYFKGERISRNKAGELVCSAYCKWVSGLKRSPVWNREEWDKIQARNKQKKAPFGADWDKLLGGDSAADHDYSLGDPQTDANQSGLFAALEEYFQEYDEPNRRLSAIHNALLKLKEFANACHQEICDTVTDNKPEPLRLLEYNPTGQVICDQCGTSFSPVRSDSKYCSSACRQKHYRANRRRERA